MDVSDSQYCFVCGHSNPIGLKAAMKVEHETNTASCTLIVPEEFQGWQGMVHGGIISALLDEVCAYAAMTLSPTVVTGELKTRFRKPVPVGQEVTLTARVLTHNRRTLNVEAQLSMQGVVMAGAEAKMVIVSS